MASNQQPHQISLAVIIHGLELDDCPDAHQCTPDDDDGSGNKAHLVPGIGSGQHDLANLQTTAARVCQECHHAISGCRMQLSAVGSMLKGFMSFRISWQQ